MGPQRLCPLRAVNVTLFGQGVLANVIKLRMEMRSYEITMGPEFDDESSFKRRHRGGMGMAGWSHQRLEEARKDPLLEASERGSYLLTPRVPVAGLWRREGMSPCFKQPSVRPLSQQPQETKTVVNFILIALETYSCLWPVGACDRAAIRPHPAFARPLPLRGLLAVPAGPLSWDTVPEKCPHLCPLLQPDHSLRRQPSRAAVVT